MTTPPPFQLAGYADIEFIDAGGIGRVYRARRLSGGIVAIKELTDLAADGRAWHRAHRELEAMLRLKGHPGVVTVEEIVDGPSGPCIVMEYLPAGSLKDRVGDGRLPLPEVVLIGQQVADALDEAHRQGVVHRDVKPHNLLVSSFGHVKVADFGIAALIRDAGSMTRTNAMTLAYASPEELAEADEVGPPADVYSLCATLEHLLTGHRPTLAERFAPPPLPPPRSPAAASDAAGDSGGGATPRVDPADEILRAALAAGRAFRPEDRPTMADLATRFGMAAEALGPSRIARLPVDLPPRRPPTTAPIPATPPHHHGEPAPDTVTFNDALARRDEAATVQRSDSAVDGSVAMTPEVVSGSPSRRRLAAIGGAVVVGAGGLAAVLALTLGGGGSTELATSDSTIVPEATEGPPATEAPTTTTTTSTTTSTTTTSTTMPTTTTSSTSTTTSTSTSTSTSTTTTLPSDIVAAENELRQLAERDRTYVNTNLLGSVVVAVGTGADDFDVAVDSRLMLAEYHDLTSRLGRLVVVQAADYGLTSDPDSTRLVLLVATPFSSGAPAGAWCTTSGLTTPQRCDVVGRLRLS